MEFRAAVDIEPNDVADSLDATSKQFVQGPELWPEIKNFGRLC
jgi:hypothetical protein